MILKKQIGQKATGFIEIEITEDFSEEKPKPITRIQISKNEIFEFKTGLQKKVCSAELADSIGIEAVLLGDKKVYLSLSRKVYSAHQEHLQPGFGHFYLENIYYI